MTKLRTVAKGIATAAIAVGLTVGIAGVSTAAPHNQTQINVRDSGWD